MKQRVSLITLGISDLQRARAFYEALGWKTGAGQDDDVVFFQTGEMVLALWDRGRLAEDSCVTAGSSSTPRATPGRSPTIRTGRSPLTAA